MMNHSPNRIKRLQLIILPFDYDFRQ